MEFSSFTFFVTEDCNFDCSYCYQRKRKKYIDFATLKKTLDFFLPFLTKGSYINFYGGEPLLAFDRIRYAVDYVKEKSNEKGIQYSMTTNGSLIDETVLRFLNEHKFALLLSFDGIAQNKCRKKGSFNQLVSVIGGLLENPGIDLETNSVFTPGTVGLLKKSIRFIAELGVPNISISLSQVSSWDRSSLIRFKKELKSLRGFLRSFYQEGRVPLVHFRRNAKKGFFTCYAGRDRLAMNPDGELWGCHLFLDYFKEKKESEESRKYCFGDLDSFVESYKMIYPQVLSHYSNLRMSHFYTQETACIQCDEVKECRVCPVDNLFSGSSIRAVPSWVCETHKIFREERRIFWEELESGN